MATTSSGSPTLRAWVIVLSVLIGSGLVLACSPGATTQAPSSGASALFIDADTVLGPTNLTAAEKTTKTCVQASRFAHNEEVVWRVKVIDPVTGKPMDDKTLASLKLKLPDQTLELHYGGHPKSTPVDFFWTIGWDVPAGYPTGTVDYTLVATAKDGRTGEYNQFKVALAMLTVTNDVRPIIAPAATPAPSK
jgi:hypothetical protein